jgi:hypothetical protein
MLHSLDSVCYLKLENVNYINFKCQDPENRVISVEQEYLIKGNDDQFQTRYETIYNIKIHRMNIRELLMTRSFLFA